MMNDVGPDPAFVASQSSRVSPSRPEASIGGKEAFTPGPWLYRPQEFDDWGLVRSQPDEELKMGGIICQAHDPAVWSEDQLNEHRRNKTDPWEANARLIAAAPELYEAGDALDNFAWGACITTDCKESGVYLQSLIDKLRAALAKARGIAQPQSDHSHD